MGTAVLAGVAPQGRSKFIPHISTSSSRRGKAATCIALHCIALIGLGNALAQPEMPRIGLIDSHAFDLAQRLQHQAEHLMPLGVAYVEALNPTLTTYLRARYGRETIPRERDIGRLSRLHCEEL